MKTAIERGQRLAQGSRRKARQTCIKRGLDNAQGIARLGLRASFACQSGKICHALDGRMPVCTTGGKRRLLPSSLELDARERVIRIGKVIRRHVA